MKKLFLFFIITFTILSCTLSLSADSTDSIIKSPAGILMDLDSGRVLFDKEAEKKMYPASTTKIMTAILCIEHGNLDDIVTVGTNPPLIEVGSSQIYLVTGERMTLEQLLYALMLESANDAAEAIAEHIAGTVSDFAKMMNDKARELGAHNTNFTNPHGLPDDDHYTTAKDLALMARYGMTLPKFREVVKTVKYTIPETNKQPERNYITNTNKSIWTINKRYRYEHAIGIKTGYSSQAKSCFVTAAEKNGITLIAAVLGKENDNSNGDNIFTETKDILEYGFEKYHLESILKKNQMITSIEVGNKKDKIELLSWENFSILLSDEESNKLQKNIVIYDDIRPPIDKGQTLGFITYSLEGTEVKSIPLTSSKEIKAPKLLKSYIIYIIIGLILLRLIILFIKRIINRRKTRYRF